MGGIPVATKRRIKIFSAGCPACEESIRQIQAAVCPSCGIEVLDMGEHVVAKRALHLGVRTLPAVAIDGMLAGCCAGRGIDIATLKAAGLGKA
jgi:hypothetical protein